MNRKEMGKILIYNADEVTKTALQEVLKRFEWDTLCRFETDGDSVLKLKPAGEERFKENDTFGAPTRLGAVLDRIQGHLRADAKGDYYALTVGPYTLDDLGYDLIEAGSGKRIRITDKEKDILAFLKINEGKEIKRAALLEAVWDYAHNVETHTLETHIYRLRQKIEKDPANPEYLITTDNGYVLKA